MKKKVLTTLLLSSLAMGNTGISKAEHIALQNEIKTLTAQKKALEAKIKKFQAKLPPNEALMSKIKLGYTKTEGNTQTQTLSLDAKTKKAWKKNRVEMIFDAKYGESDNIETNNKYLAELSYKYATTKNFLLTYLVGYKYDKFSTYDYQSYSGPGLKFIAIKTKKQKFNIEASVLYSMDKLQKKYIITTPNFKEQYSSYRTKANYNWQIFKDIKFEQELSYRSSFEETQNYFIYSKSALSSKISAMLSTGVSYKIDYTNQVAEGIKRKDTTMEAFLSIDY